MKSRQHPLTIVAALAAAITGFTASTLRAEDPGKKHSPMEEAMEAIDNAYKELGKSLREPDAAKKADYAKLAATIRENAEKSSGMLPKKVESLPEDKKKEEAEAYKKDMAAFVESVKNLEKAIADGKFEEAAALHKDLRKAKSSGHERYKAADNE